MQLSRLTNFNYPLFVMAKLLIIYILIMQNISFKFWYTLSIKFLRHTFTKTHNLLVYSEARGADKFRPLLIYCLKSDTFWFSGRRMFDLITFLFRAFFNLFKSKKQLLIQNCLQKKEIEILMRQNQKKSLNIYQSDRIRMSWSVWLLSSSVKSRLLIYCGNTSTILI